MSVRNKISERNPYRLTTHRFLELKHHCLQIPEWEKRILEIQSLIGVRSIDIDSIPGNHYNTDFPYWREVSEMIELEEQIEDIRKISYLTDETFGKYIYESISVDRSFEYLQTHYDLPMCRDTWYRNYYRKFFWILDKKLKQDSE